MMRVYDMTLFLCKYLIFIERDKKMLCKAFIKYFELFKQMDGICQQTRKTNKKLA